MSDGEKDRLGDKLRELEKAREDQFFGNRDRELLQKLKAQTASTEEQTIRELAKGRCPDCGERLATRTKLDVEIHECPSGHGMWLGAGELEKIAARETTGWLSRFLGRPS